MASSSSSHIPDPRFVCFSEYIADLQLPLSPELLLTRRYFFLHHQLSVSFRFLCSLYFIFPASPSLQLCLQFLNTWHSTRGTIVWGLERSLGKQETWVLSLLFPHVPFSLVGNKDLVNNWEPTNLKKIVFKTLKKITNNNSICASSVNIRLF